MPPPIQPNFERISVCDEDDHHHGNDAAGNVAARGTATTTNDTTRSRGKDGTTEAQWFDKTEVTAAELGLIQKLQEHDVEVMQWQPGAFEATAPDANHHEQLEQQRIRWNRNEEKVSKQNNQSSWLDEAALIATEEGLVSDEPQAGAVQPASEENHQEWDITPLPATDLDGPPMPQFVRYNNNENRRNSTQPGAFPVSEGRQINGADYLEEPDDDTEQIAEVEQDVIEASSSGDDGLAQARAVMDGDEMYHGLPQAQHVDHEQLQLDGQKANILQGTNQACVVGCIVIAIWLAVIATVVGLAILKEKDTGTSAGATGNLELTIIPTFSPTKSSPPDYLLSFLYNLPEATLAKINTFDSPQWEGYNWLSMHPDLPTMPDWRKVQLFALATIYFALNGPAWREEVHDRWLLYDKSECFWFSSAFGDWDPEYTMAYKETNNISLEPCNEQEQFQALNLAGLELPPSLGDKHLHLPPEVALLTSLSLLSVRRSNIGATMEEFIPTELYQMTNLTRLELQNNNFIGTIPSQVYAMTQLTHLWLFHNLLTGSIPTQVGRLTELNNFFSLFVNHITGTLPTEVGLLTKLEGLRLHSNAFSGTVPTELGRLSALRVFDLDTNLFHGNIPTEIGKLGKNTRWFGMHSNDLSGPIPSELGLLTSATRLWLYDNDITGSIPSELFQMTNINDMMALHLNSLTGSIPTEIGALSTVVDLHLWNNSLTGALPSELGELTSVTMLILGMNELSGPIPSEVANMNSLQQFALRDNYLSGSIPSELATMDKLTMLWLSNNLLSGTIPKSFEDHSLWGFFSEENNLSGSIPERLCTLGPCVTSPDHLGYCLVGFTYDCGELCGCSECACND